MLFYTRCIYITPASGSILHSYLKIVLIIFINSRLLLLLFSIDALFLLLLILNPEAP